MNRYANMVAYAHVQNRGFVLMCEGYVCVLFAVTRRCHHGGASTVLMRMHVRGSCVRGGAGRQEVLMCARLGGVGR